MNREVESGGARSAALKMDTVDELDAPLARMAAAIGTLQAPARVRDRCLIELRRQAGRRTPFGALWSGAGWAIRLRPLRLQLLGALAAALVAAAAIYWGLFAPSKPERLAQLSSVPQPAAGVQIANLASDADDDAAAASYVPLPYSDPSIANGTETTVEVSLPVSQLMAWGVPAPGREPGDVVPVDLVLGDDGLPMAVQVLSVSASPTPTTEEIYP